jgi:hypothetical protein
MEPRTVAWRNSRDGSQQKQEDEFRGQNRIEQQIPSQHFEYKSVTLNLVGSRWVH